MKFTIEIEITQEQYDLLMRCKSKRYLEYRDDEMTLEKYLKIPRLIEQSDEILTNLYNIRNEGGSIKIALELYELGLFEYYDNAWNTSFVLSELGERIVC